VAGLFRALVQWEPRTKASKLNTTTKVAACILRVNRMHSLDFKPSPAIIQALAGHDFQCFSRRECPRLALRRLRLSLLGP
jgi:hypothetical protein